MKGASLARLARYLVAAFLGAALAALALRRTAMSGGDCEVVGDGVKVAAPQAAPTSPARPHTRADGRGRTQQRPVTLECLGMSERAA